MHETDTEVKSCFNMNLNKTKAYENIENYQIYQKREKNQQSNKLRIIKI